MKNTKVSYSSFSQPLFFSAKSCVPLHKAATTASVAVQLMGWSMYPAAQIVVDLKEGKSENYGKFRLSFSICTPYHAPAFLHSYSIALPRAEWWSCSPRGGLGQAFSASQKGGKIVSSWTIPEPSTYMNSCARRVGREDGRLKGNPAQENRESKGTNTRTALGVKRLWLIASW